MDREACTARCRKTNSLPFRLQEDASSKELLRVPVRPYRFLHLSRLWAISCFPAFSYLRAGDCAKPNSEQHQKIRVAS